MNSLIPFSPDDVDEPAANTAAVVTYAAESTGRHILHGVAWSYDAAPTGGNLTIEDGEDVVFSMDITSEGAGFVEFPEPRIGTLNTDLIITLAAGGADVTGKLSVTGHEVRR